MGPRRLTLLRHGHAQPFEAQDTDFARPLTARGSTEAGEMGARLAIRELVPALILASPAARTRSTAEIVAARCAVPAARIRYVDELYQASDDDIWRLVGAAPAAARHVLVCGHNPGLSRLAGRLGPEPRSLDLPPAGAASAHWTRGDWKRLEPHAADACEILLPEKHRGR